MRSTKSFMKNNIREYQDFFGRSWINKSPFLKIGLSGKVWKSMSELSVNGNYRISIYNPLTGQFGLFRWKYDTRGGNFWEYGCLPCQLETGTTESIIMEILSYCDPQHYSEWKREK